MIRPIALLAAAAALLAACSDAPRSDAGRAARNHLSRDSGASPAPAVTVALVDSIDAAQQMAPVALYRVEVRSGAAVDTVPGVWVEAAPLVVDGAVVGLAADSVEGAPNAAFRYDLAAKRVQLVRLSGVAAVDLGRPALAPDGRFVAHGAVMRDGTSHAEVRALPGGQVVARGPAVPLANAEYVENFARWTAPDAYEVYVHLVDEAAEEAQARWVRVRGRVGGGAAVQVDTVHALPAGAVVSAGAEGA